MKIMNYQILVVLVSLTAMWLIYDVVTVSKVSYRVNFLIIYAVGFITALGLFAIANIFTSRKVAF